MLHAIHKNKAGQSLKSESVHWRTLFKRSEDSLTSTIFERLLYLPGSVFWQILKSSCYENKLPDSIGNIKQIEFWPHWDATSVSFNDSDDERNLVEPDVFIQFEELDLIIEAKIDKSNKQKRYQWEWQINSYYENYQQDQKPLYYIALDGLNNNTIEIVESNGKAIEIVKCTWQRLLYEVLNQLHKEQKTANQSNSGTIRLLADLKLAFELHGYFTGDWLESLPQHYSFNQTNLYQTLAWEN